MIKRKATGAGRMKMPAHVVRKSKSVPLSGPKDPVKRSIPKAAAAPAQTSNDSGKASRGRRSKDLPVYL